MADQVKETWRNSTKGKRHVVKYDPKGNEVTEIIKAGGTVAITPEERELNMDRAANDKLCIFRNGSLVPVRILDENLKAEFASNPNNIGDGELGDLFKLQWKQFDARLDEIDNLYALERLRDFAEDSENGATVRQHNSILNRLEAINENKVAESDHRIVDSEYTGFKPRAAG